MKRIKNPKSYPKSYVTTMVKKLNRVTRKIKRDSRAPDLVSQGKEFDADPITIYNWEGGLICRCVRGSKRHIWAFKMWLAEGFTITFKGQKIRGEPGNWLIIDGTEKYILTERRFRKKFREIKDELLAK